MDLGHQPIHFRRHIRNGDLLITPAPEGETRPRRRGIQEGLVVVVVARAVAEGQYPHGQAVTGKEHRPVGQAAVQIATRIGDTGLGEGAHGFQHSGYQVVEGMVVGQGGEVHPGVHQAGDIIGMGTEPDGLGGVVFRGRGQGTLQVDHHEIGGQEFLADGIEDGVHPLGGNYAAVLFVAPGHHHVTHEAQLHGAGLRVIAGYQRGSPMDAAVFILHPERDPVGTVAIEINPGIEFRGGSAVAEIPMVLQPGGYAEGKERHFQAVTGSRAQSVGNLRLRMPLVLLGDIQQFIKPHFTAGFVFVVGVDQVTDVGGVAVFTQPVAAHGKNEFRPFFRGEITLVSADLFLARLSGGIGIAAPLAPQHVPEHIGRIRQSQHLPVGNRTAAGRQLPYGTQSKATGRNEFTLIGVAEQV